MYATKIKNRITFKIKTGYFERLTPETIKLLGSTKNKITIDENGDNILLLGLSPKNFIFLKAFDSKFPYTEVWFTDQISKLTDIENRINIILVLN